MINCGQLRELTGPWNWVWIIRAGWVETSKLTHTHNYPIPRPWLWMVRATSWKKVWSGKALLKHLLLWRGESHVQTSDASAFLLLLGGLRARRRQERINVKTQGRRGGPGVTETRGPHLRGQPYTSGKVWTMQGGGHDRTREGKTAPLRCPCAIEGETSTPGPGCLSPIPTSACSLEA